MNALFQGAVDMNLVNQPIAISEINALIVWQEERKKWHQDKTRQKMAAEGTTVPTDPLSPTAFRSSDFGLNEMDVADLQYSDEDPEEEESEDDNLDPIASERKRRKKKRDHLRRTAGEPVKPVVTEVGKMMEGFLSMLRGVLAD